MNLNDGVVRLQTGKPDVDMINTSCAIVGTIARDISLVVSNPVFARIAALLAGRRGALETKSFCIVARNALGRGLFDDELFRQLRQTIDAVVGVAADELCQLTFAQGLDIGVDARPRP